MKIKNLQALLRKRNIDAALFLNLEFDALEPNILYFSDYSGIGALVVPKKSKPFLVVPQMEYTKAKLTNIPVIKKQKNKNRRNPFFILCFYIYKMIKLKYFFHNLQNDIIN